MYYNLEEIQFKLMKLVFKCVCTKQMWLDSTFRYRNENTIQIQRTSESRRILWMTCGNVYR